MTLSAPLYIPAPVPSGTPTPLYLQNELRKIAEAIQRVYEQTPQVANQAPTRPQQGWQRYAVSPWNPLGTGSNVWVYFDGATWKAL